MPEIGFLAATDETDWKKYISVFEKQLESLDWTITNPATGPKDVRIA